MPTNVLPPPTVAMLQDPSSPYKALLLKILPNGLIPKEEKGDHLEVRIEVFKEDKNRWGEEIIEEQRQARMLAFVPATLVSSIIGVLLATLVTLPILFKGYELNIVAILLLVCAGAMSFVWYALRYLRVAFVDHGKKVWRLRGRMVAGEVQFCLTEYASSEFALVYDTWSRLRTKLLELGKIHPKSEVADLSELDLNEFPYDYLGMLRISGIAAIALSILFVVGSVGVFIFIATHRAL